MQRLAAARQLSLQGLEAQRRGHWSEAESLFAAAILQCPADERARCGYAEALWQRGAQAAAVAHMEEAVRLSGYDPQRLVQLGRMYLALGSLPRAGESAARAIQANSQHAAAWALQGEVLLAQGRMDDALAALHRAMALQQPLPEAQLAAARIYLLQGRTQRAYSTLEALAATYPPDQVPVEVLMPMGMALRQMGRAAEAEQRLTQAVQRGSPSADLWYELAQAQLALGDAVEARQSVQAALERDPQHAPSLALRQSLGPGAPGMAVVRTPGGVW
jgi:tetratricopeptide (TPR) repeat protein